MEEKKPIDFVVLDEAFANDGWKKYIQFMVGSRWEKGNDTVTCYMGKYKLNGKPVSKEYICRMLNIDTSLRIYQVCAAVAPHPLSSKYGQAFLAGVRWADEHPVCKG